MKIGFIGAGKVGFSLGKYFSINNIRLSGYYSSSFKSSEEAAVFTDSRAYINIEDFINETDIIFITTPDDIILKIWMEIRKFNLKGKYICHCSGSLSSKIFSNSNNSGAILYSIHPMYAFSDKYNSYKNLKDAFFSIEGDSINMDFIKEVFNMLPNKYFVLNSDIKPLYHLANVTVSNLVLSLIDIGCNALIKCGIEEEYALEALLPLIENNINNLNSKSIFEALTGPVERGDLNTIRHHIEVMPKDLEKVYRELSLNLVKLSEKKHTHRDYSHIKKYLNNL